MTLFEKIAAHQIPAKIIQEDDDLIVFHDINPQAPIHVLVVPKKPIPRLNHAKEEDGKLLGKLLLKAREIAGLFATRLRTSVRAAMTRYRIPPA
jgi:histidine triad (HIT) family protein